ncbi:coiled-coil domain-containing protein 107 isoform X2 [Ranitomeya variabilis]|uniref:coiled-coil domain-containing protein 107 isoform X2 n=1 Tax=Ranitomeya variabilis TaxID=490064 RepID=UPI004056E887
MSRSALPPVPGPYIQPGGIGTSQRAANESAGGGALLPRAGTVGGDRTAVIMVLSSSQHLLLSLSLALCACFLLPRMFGAGVKDSGKQEAGKMPPPGHGRPASRGNGESQAKYHSSRKILENSNHYEQMKGEMEKQLKSERTETGHSMAFTLMPLYAVGVALFAAYKFSKMQPKEKIGSKTSEGEEKKSKETENQLLVLEKHLLQTEKMLSSLLTQLDPLSSCVNSLATEQKDEIMNQLLSIRQLMKKSGMDKSTINNSGQSCEDTFENLIDSFRVQKSEISGEDLSNLDAVDLELPVHDPVSEEPAMQIDSHSKEDSSLLEERDLTAGRTSDGLRKRNIKD